MSSLLLRNMNISSPLLIQFFAGPHQIISTEHVVSR